MPSSSYSIRSPLVHGSRPIVFLARRRTHPQRSVRDDGKSVLNALLKHGVGVLATLIDSQLVDMSGYPLEKSVSVWSSYLPAASTSLEQEANTMKLLKYKCDAFVAYWADQPIPLCPFPGTMVNDKPHILFGGRVHNNVMRKLVRWEEIRKWSFLQGVQQAKKGFERPSSAMVQAKVKETFKALTTEAKYPAPGRVRVQWSTMDERSNQVEFGLNRATVEAELRRTVGQFFPPSVARSFREQSRRMTAPSFNANYTTSKSKFGTFGLAKMNKEIVLLARAARSEGIVEVDPLAQALASYLDDPEELRTTLSIVSPESQVVRTSFAYEEACDLIVDEIHKEAEAEMKTGVKVTLVGLAEALKVRTISKGPPWVYWRLKRLQKYLWAHLQKFPYFRFTGKPANGSDLNDILGVGNPHLRWFLSGDYSAATNGIFSWISDVVVDELSRNLLLDGEETAQFHAALTGHMIKDPESGILLRQMMGQLMGSIVSFPILCLINFALCRWVLELDAGRRLPVFDRSGRRLNPTPVPVMINGDDCVLRGSSGLKALWELVCPFFGFTPSPGKYYFSQRFLQINSTTYIVDVDDRFHLFKQRPRVNGIFPGADRDWDIIPTECSDVVPESSDSVVVRRVRYVEVPYVNMGLVENKSRSSTVNGAEKKLAEQALDPSSSIGSRASALLAMAPRDLESHLLSIFINKNWRTLKALSKYQIPWYLPPLFGGLGLPTIQGTKFVPSDKDLRLAANMVYSGDLFGLFSSYASKDEIGIVQYVNTLMRANPILQPSLVFDNEDAWDRFSDVKQGLFMPALLLALAQRKEKKDEAQKKVKKKDPLTVALKKNSKVWSDRLRAGKLWSSPLPANFINRKKFGYLVPISLEPTRSEV